MANSRKPTFAVVRSNLLNFIIMCERAKGEPSEDIPGISGIHEEGYQMHPGSDLAVYIDNATDGALAMRKKYFKPFYEKQCCFTPAGKGFFIYSEFGSDEKFGIERLGDLLDADDKYLANLPKEVEDWVFASPFGHH